LSFYPADTVVLRGVWGGGGDDLGLFPLLRVVAGVYVSDHFRMPEPVLWRSVLRLPAHRLRAVREAGPGQYNATNASFSGYEASLRNLQSGQSLIPLMTRNWMTP